jgi:hypothetical protein
MAKKMFIKSVGFSYKERRLIEKVRQQFTLNDIAEKTGLNINVVSHALREYSCNSVTKEKLMGYITEISESKETTISQNSTNDIEKTNVRSNFNINSAK